MSAGYQDRSSVALSEVEMGAKSVKQFLTAVVSFLFVSFMRYLFAHCAR